MYQMIEKVYLNQLNFLFFSVRGVFICHEITIIVIYSMVGKYILLYVCLYYYVYYYPWFYFMLCFLWIKICDVFLYMH